MLPDNQEVIISYIVVDHIQLDKKASFKGHSAVNFILEFLN